MTGGWRDETRRHKLQFQRRGEERRGQERRGKGRERGEEGRRESSCNP